MDIRVIKVSFHQISYVLRQNILLDGVVMSVSDDMFGYETNKDCKNCILRYIK